MYFFDTHFRSIFTYTWFVIFFFEKTKKKFHPITIHNISYLHMNNSSLIAWTSDLIRLPFFRNGLHIVGAAIRKKCNIKGSYTYSVLPLRLKSTKNSRKFPDGMTALRIIRKNKKDIDFNPWGNYAANTFHCHFFSF